MQDLVDHASTTDKVALAGLVEVVAHDSNGLSTYTWLTKSAGRRLLNRIVDGDLALTHEAFDQERRSTSIAHLRHLLVAAAALPRRDEQLALLQLDIDRLASTVEHATDRSLFRKYATWDVLHRLRTRPGIGEITRGMRTYRSKKLRSVASLIDHMRRRGTSIQEGSQVQLDVWLAADPRRGQLASSFVSWLTNQNRSIDLRVPRKTKTQITSTVDEDLRWNTARRALHDESLPTEVRVAASLVLLYAQRTNRIVRLERRQLNATDSGVTLAFGATPIEIPEPLAGLILALPARRQLGLSSIPPGQSEWLFPGRYAGRHMAEATLQRRLREIGITARAYRSSALLQLATEVPAAVLADMLGIHPNTAEAWAKTAGGNWTSYAAGRLRTSNDPVAPC